MHSSLSDTLSVVFFDLQEKKDLKDKNLLMGLSFHAILLFTAPSFDALLTLTGLQTKTHKVPYVGFILHIIVMHESYFLLMGEGGPCHDLGFL